MKKVIILFLLLGAAECVFSQNKETRYVLPDNKGELIWKAAYIMGGGHEGTLQLTSGYAKTSDGVRVTGGEFVMDMNSIENTDIKPEEEDVGLEDHLRAEDFFHTAKYPKGIFSIKKSDLDIKTDFASSQPGSTSSPYRFIVTGFLTLKEITHEISFPAIIRVDKDVMHIEAEIMLDRTRWQINHQSKSIFADLKDGVISDYINVRLDLKLKKS